MTVTITSKDINGNDVTVVIRPPSKDDYNQSNIAYSKAFREALNDGAMLRDKLNTYYEEQGVWDKKKQTKHDNLLKEISALGKVLDKGGIPLTEAKEAAIDLRTKRAEFRELVAERQSYDRNCAESLADNQRFNFFMSACVHDEKNQNRMWKDLKTYNEDVDHPWAVEAAEKLANMLYGIQEDYEKKLTENKFLVDYGFADSKTLILKNNDGHLIDNEGRLINEEGRFVAYDDDGNQYFVDIDGNKVEDEVKFSPFLDDDGKPIQLASEEPEEKPKRTRRKKTPEPENSV
jgi:hypothetical protein